MQESAYRLNAKGCHFGLQVNSISNFIGKNNPEVKVCSDFGISQIYFKTAKAFKFEIDRLTTDLDYSVEAGAIVLADFKRMYGHRELDWYTRYNASSRGKRNIYKNLVARYL